MRQVVPEPSLYTPEIMFTKSFAFSVLHVWFTANVTVVALETTVTDSRE